jgi:hypothetical protein
LPQKERSIAYVTKVIVHKHSAHREFTHKNFHYHLVSSMYVNRDMAPDISEKRSEEHLTGSSFPLNSKYSPVQTWAWARVLGECSLVEVEKF